MKKNIIIVLLLIILSLGCVRKENSYSINFKEEYEILNDITNKNGKQHRSVSIDKNNPYQKVTPKDVIDKIESKETFYLYVGDSLCPWCRSVIEKSIEVANNKKIDKIYYIEIWDDEGNEILRDKYQLNDGKVEKIKDGTDEYYKMLDYFEYLLSDYTLTDEDGKKVSVGEKRIFAPNFIYIEYGTAKKLVEGISDKQKDSREELTEDILKDEEKIFEDFFSN